ncbi:MAG: hypothetical protein Q4E24_06495 [bacterium]|nr:hypothetical protein [bacterium]
MDKGEKRAEEKERKGKKGIERSKREGKRNGDKVVEKEVDFSTLMC